MSSVNRIGWVLSTLLLIILLVDFYYPISLNKQQFAKVITAQDGTPLRSFADKQGVWRYSVKIKQVSPLYIQALVHYEDRWFWHHLGVNPISIIRAVMQNITSNKIISGGSTLTMQVARLIRPHSRSISGKVKQIATALQLEFYFSKAEILEYYLNYAPFGGTLEGVQAASYTYLGKSALELSHAEAALLAVLPQAPSRNRPDRYPSRAMQVRNKVLQRLATQSVWPKQIINDAIQEPIIAQHHRQVIIAPLLARRLKSEIKDKLVIKTTLDMDMQLGVAELVKNYVQQLPEKTSAAVLIVENKTLKVKAYVGSADFFDASRLGHVDMIKALRSPGSTLKPFLYGIAIDEGLIHSESLLMDAPLSFDGYKPQNFSRGFNGPVSVKQALTRSLNIPAVQVLYHLSPDLFVSRLKNAGLKLQFNQNAKSNLSVILGGVGSSLETLVGSYTALANGGLAGKIRFTENTKLAHRYLLSEGSAWIIQNILSSNNPNHLAWKTGTSYGHRDFWSIGVTPTYTVGVWVGRPDGSSLPGYYGAETASPLLFLISDRLPQKGRFKQPSSVTKQTICWPLGKKQSETKSDLCHEKKQTWILNNNIPLTLPHHEKGLWEMNPMTIKINLKTGLVVNHSCNIKTVAEKEIALWPLAVEPWIAKKNQRQLQLGEFDPSCQYSAINAFNKFEIVGLENNSKLRSAGASKKLPRIKLLAQGGQGKLYWFINGYLKYTVTNFNPVFHQFDATGRYQITVLDDAGHSDSLKLTVI